MIHYLKAEFYRLYAEKRFAISLTVLLLVSFLAALIYKEDIDIEYTIDVVQLLSFTTPLFLISPVSAFFGDDFFHRTINNTITKDRKRQKLLVNKLVASLLFGFFYLVMAHASSSLFRWLLGGQVNLVLTLTTVSQQLPIYACLILFCSAMFIFFNKGNQIYTTYLLICLLFDNLASLFLNNLLKLNIPSDFFLFATLQNKINIPLTTHLFSLCLSLLFAIFCYRLFMKKELK